MMAACISRFPGTEAILWHHYGTAGLYRVLYLAANWLFKPCGLGQTEIFHICLNLIHSACGGFFALIAFKLSILKGNEPFQKAIIFITILSSGVFLTFTHQEFYAPSLVFAIWAFYLILKNESNGKSRIYIIPLIFAIILNPLYIYIAFGALLTELPKKKRNLIIEISALCFVVYLILGIIFKLPLEKNIIVFSDPKLFCSLHHLLLFINLVLFSSLAVPAFIFRRGKTYKKGILFFTSIIALILVIMLKMDYGAMDWDLATTILLPLMLMSALHICTLDRKISLPIALICLIISCTWFYLNVSIERGMNKGESMILVQKTEYFCRKPPEERLIQIYHRNIFRQKRLDRIEKWCEICRAKYPYRTMPYVYSIFVALEKDMPKRAAYTALKAFEKTNIERKMLPAVINIIAESDSAELESIILRMERGGEKLELMQSFPVNRKLENEIERLAIECECSDTLWNKSLIEVLHISGYVAYLASSGDLEGALAFYKGGRKLYPFSPAIPNNWGIILNYLRNTDEARKCFGIALSLGSSKGNYYNNMASSYYNEGKYIEAMKYIEKAIEIEPGRAIFNINCTAILFKLGRKGEGISKLKAYVENADNESAELTRAFMHEMGFIN